MHRPPLQPQTIPLGNPNHLLFPALRSPPASPATAPLPCCLPAPLCPGAGAPAASPPCWQPPPAPGHQHTRPGMFCLLLPDASWQRHQPGEAKPVWGGAALVPPAWGTGVLAGQRPTARRTPAAPGVPPGSGAGMPGDEDDSPAARTGPRMPMATPSLPAVVSGSCRAPWGSHWLWGWRLPPLFPPRFLFSCFSSPNQEARWLRARPFPAAFGRSPGRPLAPPAARSLLPPQLLICFGGEPRGSLPAPEPPRWGAGAVRDAVPESPSPKGKGCPWTTRFGRVSPGGGMRPRLPAPPVTNFSSFLAHP